MARTSRRRWAGAVVVAAVAVATGVIPAAVATADGETWDVTTSVDPPGYVDLRLDGTSCTADGSCMAVGWGTATVDGSTAERSVAETNASGQWALTPLVHPSGGYGDRLVSVSCITRDDCTAVGEHAPQGAAAGNTTLAEHWNGAAWTAEQPVNAGVGFQMGGSFEPASVELDGVACPSSGLCLTVGQDTHPQDGQDLGGGWNSLIERRSGLAGDFATPATTDDVAGEPTTSPGGTYTATWDTAAHTVTVRSAAHPGITLLNGVAATIGGWSPDDYAFVTETLSGGVVTVHLYNLLGANPGTPVFSATPTATSSRLSFDPTGRYLFFGWTTAQQTFLDVADTVAPSNGDQSVFTTGGFIPSGAYGDVDDSVGNAVYGFSPDGTHFAYGYLTDAGHVTWHWVDLVDSPTRVNTAVMNGTSGFEQFSPAGHAFALVTGLGGGSSVRVDMWDSRNGTVLGGGQFLANGPVALKASATKYVATIDAVDHTIADSLDIGWTVDDSPTPPTPQGFTYAESALLGISCVSSTDCVAVGTAQFRSDSYYEVPLVQRWDGSTWSIDDVGAPGSGNQVLRAVSCVASAASSTGDACTAVGDFGQVLTWDGLGASPAWTSTTVTVPNQTVSLTGVSCTAATDCRLAGETREGAPSDLYSAAVYTGGGTTWSQLPSTQPGSGSQFQGLFGVACWAPAECDAVGQYHDSSGNGRTLVEADHGAAGAALTVTTTALPDGAPGTAYSTTLEASGGTPPYTWQVTDGTLPDGLTLSPDGTLSGTPTTAGPYDVSAQVLDSTSPASLRATQQFTLTVAQQTVAPQLTSRASASVVVGHPLSFVVTATGQPVPVITRQGTLPSGIGFHPAANGTATLSGTPPLSAAGVYHLTLRATNGTAPDASQSFTLTVVKPVIAIKTGSAAVHKGAVPMRLACSKAACAGTVTLVRRGKVLAKASYHLGVGRSATVQLTLTAAGRTAFAHAAQHPVGVTAKATVVHGTTASRAVTVT